MTEIEDQREEQVGEHHGGEDMEEGEPHQDEEEESEKLDNVLNDIRSIKDKTDILLEGVLRRHCLDFFKKKKTIFMFA